MWQVHPSSSIAKPGFAATSAASVFPRYSTRLFKETLAVTGLVLFLMAVVMPLTLATPYSFSNSPALTACSTPDHMIAGTLGHRFGQEAHEVGFTKTQMLRIRK
jgi:hypothetical protein